MLVIASSAGCTHPLVKKLDSFRAAKKRGDYAEANRYLADDARIWFEKKEGPGRPYTAKGGPYKEWDKEFRATSKRGELEVKGSTVTYLSTETNDFYRFLEQSSRPARITYFFEDQLITGMLYEGNTLGLPRSATRRGEFEAWAEEHYPGLLKSEGMKIPNNPKRWRELLVEWRADVGLPPID